MMQEIIKRSHVFLISILAGLLMIACSADQYPESKTAADILGDPDYQTISYGGYREITRDMVDDGTFDGLTRDGQPITKTFNGDKDAMMETIKAPPTEQEIMEMRR